MSGVSLLETGLANSASVIAAFTRLGVPVERISSACAVRDARRLVVPGVGAFGAAIDALQTQGLMAPLAERINAGRPTLGICLGLQLFGRGSDESPGRQGLGCVALQAVGFNDSLVTPQMGWNRVVASPEAELRASGYAYFANSYRFEQIPEGWSGAMSDYGGALVAGLERGAVLGCQFHPELSGEYGEALLARWLQRAEASC